jgi:hypothetical protein
MSVKDKILEQQIARGIFEDAEFSGSEGIAKLAVAKGFSALSTKQQQVLEPYLSKVCSGVTDPGGHHNECAVQLEGEALLDAYHRCEDTESLTCEDCDSKKAITFISGKKYLRNKA